MANAVYTLSFSDDIIGDAYTIEIWSKAVNVVPAIAIKGSGTPIKIDWRKFTDPFEPVIPSEAVVEVISETDLFWKQFFTANRGDWILKVIRESVIIWQGQNVTESYNEPYLPTPYKSSLKFSDLGDLDFTYFQQNSTTFYTGYKSLSEILFLCTNKLEFQLDAWEYTNAINLEGWNNASVTQKSLLCNTFVDVRMFRKYDNGQESAMTCMEVLKIIMRAIGCRLFQASGQGQAYVGYHVQSIEEMIASEALNTFGLDHTTYAVTTTLFTANLKREITNATGNFAAPTLDICPVNQNQDLNMSERYNRAIYKYTTQELFRKDAELILNHDFDKGVKTLNNTTKFPKYFVVSSDLSSSNACEVSSAQYVADKDLLFRAYKQTIGSVTLQPMPGFLAAQGSPFAVNSPAKYLRTSGTEAGDAVDLQGQVMSNIQVSTVDNLRLKIAGKILKGIDYGYANANGKNNEQYLTSAVFNFVCWLRMTLDNGRVYYWMVTPNYPSGGNNLWATLGPYFAAPQYAVNHRMLGTKGFSNNTFSGIKYHEDNFEIVIDSPVFPENAIAEFTLRFYLPRTTGTYMQPIGLAALTLKELSLKYITDGDFSDDVIKNLVFFTVTDAKENTYTFNVQLGDGPAEYDLSSFRYGVVSATDKYKITSSWRKLDSATARTAANLFNLIPAQKLLSAYQRVITGDYVGLFDMIHTLNIDDGVDDKKYLIMGDSWNVKASIHSLTMHEITAQSISITSDDAQRTFNSQPTPNDTQVPSAVSSVFSAKANNSVILNKPSTFNVQSAKTKYPG